MKIGLPRKLSQKLWGARGNLKEIEISGNQKPQEGHEGD